MTERERGLEQGARRRGQAERDGWIASQPSEDGKPKPCPRCGTRVRVRGRGVARTFRSLWGAHTLSRGDRLMPVSENQFRQVARRLGEQVEGCEATVLEGALKAPTPNASERLYVLADGGMVSTRESWREVKVGFLFRVENHLSGHEAPRGHVSEARYTAELEDRKSVV